MPQAPIDIEATKNILGIRTDGTPKTGNCNSQDPSTNSSNSPSSNN